MRGRRGRRGTLVFGVCCRCGVPVEFDPAIWLAVATYFELPVSPQQSTQGALLGTMLVTEGFGYLPMWNKNGKHNFNGGGLLWISLEWTVAPLIACICAYCLFTILKASLLCRENAEKRILIFLPISYGISAGLLCLFLIYQALSDFTIVSKWTLIAVAIATLIGALLSSVVVVPLARKRFDTTRNFKTIEKNKSLEPQSIEIQNQRFETRMDDNAWFEEALKDYRQMRVLDTVHEEDEQSWASPETVLDSEHVQSVSQSTKDQCTQFKQLLESTPNRLVQTKDFHKIEKTTASENAFKFIKEFTRTKFFPGIEYDKHTLIRHALAQKFDEIEDLFGFPQLLASCIFAAIGGLAASLGFFLCGWRLTQCLGGKLTYMSNARGLVSQLSTVAAMIMVTRLKLPVSSTHAFVGSLTGVGIADDHRNVNWKLLIKFLCGSVLTILFCCGVGYGLFSFSIHSPAYVVL
ncbi:hypothetical protein L1049_009690 [Liquidambar formosana]|uniref:Phosphate transporter n=1 Tax=Liquidambar formosana TaxID=63359 RepID=A0AAP0R487_LIQFO